ncbi:MAG: cation:proton antiporter [Actinomycetota bacterium]|nr:cation:proton antiporter [Actinomycetota bacterium]
MTDTVSLGALIAVVSFGLVVAVLSNRISNYTRIPAPALFLIAAAILGELIPQLSHITIPVVQGAVSVALVLILFDGGMHIGWRQFRRNGRAITWLGVVGTLVTAAALAILVHYAFGMEWLLAMLLATALAPTDPAVVFSVLGKRAIGGRSDVLLEGESGANDPVGIALMVALLAASTASSGFQAVAEGAFEFVLQMGVGSLLGVLGGLALRWMTQRVALPSEGLYSIRTLAGAGLIFGVTTIAHGSGFLAVFIAGMVMADGRVPFKREIQRFHSALASLGEIVAFALLGLTVDVSSLFSGSEWLVGLAIAVALAFVIRPVLVGLVLLPIRLARNERIFVLWAGLKGAVPILLGTYILSSGVEDAAYARDLIIIVVTFSVIFQGGSIPAVTKWLKLSLTEVNPQPWTMGVRFENEPGGLLHYSVDAGSIADGCRVENLPIADEAWLSVVTRAGSLVQIRGETVLQAGDEVTLLASEDSTIDLKSVFKSEA